ncbi:MAG TPA: dienelactone hydrolase family protein [Steroidobacteraceae bacterium]|nr:dienelactone hydrolase family protein [Steroidobacteraceae bacterium]
MCDQDYANQLLPGALSRREFGKLGLGAGFAALLPRAADAAEVTESHVDIRTPDGTCDAHFVHPVAGAHAAVLVWPDIFGLRPAFETMGKRLAESGYAVLTVNPFYRQQKAPTSTSTTFNQGMMQMMNALTADGEVRDAQALIAWLDTQKAVDTKKKIGTTGYCMGGPFVLRTAGTVPGRVGAAATFHGASLTTKNPDSPHLQIAKSKASYLICIADSDDQKDPTSKDILNKTFEDAKLPHEVEVYKGAQHGWCAIDTQAYNKDLAEKAWARQLALFSKALA